MFCCLHRCFSFGTWRSLDPDSDSDSLCPTAVV